MEYLPEAPTTVTPDGWTKFVFKFGWKRWALVFLLFIAILYALVLLGDQIKNEGGQLHSFWLWVLLIALGGVVGLPLHEALHAVCLPNFGCGPQTIWGWSNVVGPIKNPWVGYLGPLSIQRFVVHRLVPFFILGLGGLILSFCVPELWKMFIFGLTAGNLIGSFYDIETAIQALRLGAKQVQDGKDGFDWTPEKALP
ncbi:DUF3267 domain-containing protein [Rhodanobacter denitrificans]|uniref:DUF3267 domain-containing protein n=1 Tax=Rhodanobacter denitrificans TaxID=666685 RepID=UPI00022DA3C8|nr:DUF3267 domain-containing protein [Rhodanobacter denitrificans]UJJ58538.1 DUF3267 domain-containing protein [Rhodanobacter denitrificans]